MRNDFLSLNVGDRVKLNCAVFTARDKAHLFLLKNHLKKLENSIIYHCGPIVKEDKVIAAGPTSSSRFNMYVKDMLKKYKIKAFIGKGGFDAVDDIKGKAVYFSAVGGAALVYAKHIKLKDVYHLEFGMPDAIWEFELKDFPVIVTVDSRGNSLYNEIKEKSRKTLDI